jgi:TetR/AcrR family transcriptional regulator, transcriptional repressor for nem operon
MSRPREFDEERVLDAVMATFWRRGYEATSAQDLVDATGLGRGSLYNAYSNKEGLFERALQHYQRRTQDNLKLLAGGAPIRDRIRRLLESATIPETRNRDRRGCLATNTAIEAGQRPRIAQLVRQNFRLVEVGLERELARAIATGEITPNREPADLAKYFLTTLQGLRVMASVASPQDRKALSGVIELSLNALT